MQFKFKEYKLGATVAWYCCAADDGQYYGVAWKSKMKDDYPRAESGFFFITKEVYEQCGTVDDLEAFRLISSCERTGNQKFQWYYEDLSEHLTKVNCRVYYEDWQWMCCGANFTVDETVKWLAAFPNPQGYGFAEGFVPDFQYEGHGGAIFEIKGKITSIKTMIFTPSEEHPEDFSPTTRELVDLPSTKDLTQGSNYCDFYVTFTDCIIRPI